MKNYPTTRLTPDGAAFLYTFVFAQNLSIPVNQSSEILNREIFYFCARNVKDWFRELLFLILNSIREVKPSASRGLCKSEVRNRQPKTKTLVQRINSEKITIKGEFGRKSTRKYGDLTVKSLSYGKLQLKRRGWQPLVSCAAKSATKTPNMIEPWKFIGAIGIVMSWEAFCCWKANANAVGLLSNV